MGHLSLVGELGVSHLAAQVVYGHAFALAFHLTAIRGGLDQFLTKCA